MLFLELKHFAVKGEGGEEKKKILWHLLIKLFRNIFSCDLALCCTLL